MKLKFIVMATLLFFIVPKAEAQSYTCGSSINTASNAAITVGANETKCLTATSGTYKPSSVTIAATGTLVVKSGVSLTIKQTANFNGTIINEGVVNFTGNLAGGNIENFSSVIVNQMQQNNGSSLNITNHGTFEINGYWALTGAYINNYDSLLFNSGGNLTCELDNSGYTYLKSGTNGGTVILNNYGLLEANSAVLFSSGTYLTNDSTMNFKSGDVQFQGALYTNNGRIIVKKNFNLNSITNGIINNGIWVVGGSITFGASARVTNNCRIVSTGDLKIDVDTVINNGLLWATGSNSKIYTTTAGGYLKNGEYGFVRGVNFENNNGVHMSGMGAFYFTGASIQNKGFINGSSSSDPIKFYNPTGDTINIAYNGYSSNINFYPTSSITPKDTNDYINCNSFIPPTYAGNPPKVKDTTITLCTAVADTFHLATDGLVAPYDNTWSIVWSKLRLFSVGGAENTLTLITAKGTWKADTVNKTIVFTPAPSFTSGTAKAQFLVANAKSGQPTTPSPKATIAINLSPVHAPTDLNAEGY